MDMGSRRDARPSNRREAAAVAIPLLEGEGKLKREGSKKTQPVQGGEQVGCRPNPMRP
jgi:hypothetical protein